jgi:hypothetical protein
MESKFEKLCQDIRETGWRDVCYICKHFETNEDCECDCETCNKPCTCAKCVDCSRWEWRGRTG